MLFQRERGGMWGTRGGFWASRVYATRPGLSARENVYVVGAVMNVLPDDTMSQQQSATRLLTTMIYGVYRRPHERESDIL